MMQTSMLMYAGIAVLTIVIILLILRGREGKK